MNINSFLTCLSYYGISTGIANSLEGVYDYKSGISGIYYNQLYPTGSNFLNGNIYGPNLPLINLSSFTGNGIYSGFFNSGLHASIGYQYTGNFGIVIDMQYSGCLKRSSYPGIDTILLTTASTPNSLDSGFYVGINDANRLFFKNNLICETLEKELSLHNFIYVGLAQSQYVTLGLYNFNEDEVYLKNIALPTGVLNTNNLYLGGFASGNTGAYTPFIGKIYSASLFNNTLTVNDIDTCSNCLITTGFVQTSSTINASGFQITGTYFSGIFTNIVTGTTPLIVNIYNESGNAIPVYLNNVSTGTFQTGELALPLYNTVVIPVNRNSYSFLYDNNILNTFATYNLEFDLSLSSGDVVEVYTYQNKNDNIDNDITGFTYPATTGFIQLYGNGLAETSGVDYVVNRNLISGFTNADILVYDIISSGTIVLPYSGYWQNSRIQLSGGTYFPPNSQYNETTGGLVSITGLNDICTGNPYYPIFGYDLYLNGQKLVSGIQYNVQPSGSGFIVNLSGANLPNFIATPLYAPTGGLPTGVSNIDTSEMTFIPQFVGFQSFIYELTGSQSVMVNLTGFSEQVWVNGIRQSRGFDYILDFPCAFTSGIVDTPNFVTPLYNSETDSIGLWNFPFPPAENPPTVNFIQNQFDTGYVLNLSPGASYRFISGQFQLWDIGYNDWDAIFSLSGQMVVSSPIPDLGQTGNTFVQLIPSGADYRFINTDMQIYDSGYSKWVIPYYISGQIFESSGIPDGGLTSTGYVQKIASGNTYRFKNNQIQFYDSGFGAWVSPVGFSGQLSLSNVIIDSISTGLSGNFILSLTPIASYPYLDGPYEEVWGRADLPPAQPFDSYHIIGYCNTTDTSYTFPNLYSVPNFRQYVKVRYRYQNIIGLFSNQVYMSIMGAGPSFTSSGKSNTSGNNWTISGNLNWSNALSDYIITGSEQLNSGSFSGISSLNYGQNFLINVTGITGTMYNFNFAYNDKDGNSSSITQMSFKF